MRFWSLERRTSNSWQPGPSTIGGGEGCQPSGQADDHSVHHKASWGSVQCRFRQLARCQTMRDVNWFEPGHHAFAWPLAPARYLSWQSDGVPFPTTFREPIQWRSQAFSPWSALPNRTCAAYGATSSDEGTTGVPKSYGLPWKSSPRYTPIWL